MQEFSFSFEMTHPSDYNTKFDFLVSESTVDIYLDDISIVEEDCVPLQCEDFKVYTDNAVAPLSDQAIRGIETNRIIEAGSMIDHHAGEYILMTSGFEVEPQAIFHAFIQACL